MDGEEYGVSLWRAGELVSAGTYLRVDDHSYRRIVLEQPDQLPASCDGHVALYCRAPFVYPMSVHPGGSHAFSQGKESQGK